MTFWLRPLLWHLVVLAALLAPVAAVSLLEVRQVDPARCTLDAAMCDKLRQFN